MIIQVKRTKDGRVEISHDDKILVLTIDQARTLQLYLELVISGKSAGGTSTNV